MLIAPLAMLVSVRALLERAPSLAEARRILGRRAAAYAFPGRARVAKLRLAGGVAAVAFLLGAGISSLLALANGPVGPSGYSPALAELRTELPAGLDRGRRPERAARRRSTGATTSPGSCAATGSASSPRASRSRAGAADRARGRRSATTARSCRTGRSDKRGATGPGPCPLIPDAARADPSAGG